MYLFLLDIVLIYILYETYKMWAAHHPYIRIMDGTGKSERRRLKSYDGTTITLYRPFKMKADNTYKFIIEK